MIVNLTAGQLLSIHNERLKLSGTFMELINRTRIQRFYEDNHLRINRIVKENGDILKEFYQFDEDGNIKMNGKNPVFNEGKTEEGLKEKMIELQKQIVPITI